MKSQKIMGVDFPPYVQTVQPGENVTVDNTDATNPKVSSSGGGGGTPTLDEVLAEGYIGTNKAIVVTNGADIAGLDSTNNSLLIETANGSLTAQFDRLTFSGFSPNGSVRLTPISGSGSVIVSIPRQEGTLLVIAATPYANNAAAISGGLTVGQGYKTVSGEIRIVV